MNDPSAKQLLVMRHAKSSWADEDATDHQRKLNKRGKHDAPRMGQFIVERGCVPELTASSTATRAVSTAELFIEQCKPVQSVELDLVDDFYHAPLRTYLEYVSELSDEKFKTVMVVGHNPGLEELVYVLSRQYERMPTAAIASFYVTTGRWQDVLKLDNISFESVWRPKEVL